MLKTPKRGHSGRTCTVVKCHSNSKKLQLWKESECDIHKPLLHSDPQCTCERPYSLHRFPGRKDEVEIRRQWVKNIGRKDFEPKDHHVVGVFFHFDQFKSYCNI